MGYNDQLNAASRRLQAATYRPTALSTMQLRVLGAVLEADHLTALNTALGSWIQHRHALLLYAKQSYTASEKSLRREAARIEPADRLYSMLIENLYRIGETQVFTKDSDLVVRGGRFNCYQFTQPLQARLSDEAWQTLLGDGKAPASWSRTLLQLQD